MFCGRRYGWVLTLPQPTQSELRAFSSTARRGWAIAEEIAKNDWRRKEEALRGVTPPPLEPRRLAQDFLLDEDELFEALAQFRIEYFGADLSDSAIYYRLQRRRRPTPICAEAGCEQPLPQAAPTHRRYCDQHRAGAARTRRHRSNTPSTTA